MIDVDFSQLPFSLLDDERRARLESAMEMAYFEADTVILEARHPAQFVYLVHKGAVLELDPTLPAEAGRLGVYSAGDLFGALSVLNGRSRYRFITEEETLCYLIPAALFQELCEGQKEFDDYFRQRLASKNQLLAERREGGVTLAGFMLAKVHQCMRQPLILDSGGTIAQAVAALNQHNADSLLMERDGHVGVITKTDLLRGLVNDGLTPDSRALALASFELVTVPPDQFLFAALVSMTRHEVQRVVVMDGRRPVGVVELTDVLSFFSSRSYVVGLEVEEGGQPGVAGNGQRAAAGTDPGADGAGRQDALRHGSAGGAERPHYQQGVPVRGAGEPSGSRLPAGAGQRRAWRADPQDRPGQRPDRGRSGELAGARRPHAAVHRDPAAPRLPALPGQHHGVQPGVGGQRHRTGRRASAAGPSRATTPR